MNSNNVSASRPNSFDNTFLQKSHVSPPFACIIYLYCNTPPPLCLDQQLRWRGTRIRVHFNLCGHGMCCYCNYWYHMNYFFLWFHRQFTWCHPWRSSSITFPSRFHRKFNWRPPWRSSRFSLLWCLHRNFTWHRFWRSSMFYFCFCTLWVRAWCCCCFVGYWYVICACPYFGPISTSRFRPLCLLVNCCSTTFGMILNNSSRLLKAVLCVSLIVEDGAFGAGFFNASTKWVLNDYIAHSDAFFMWIFSGANCNTFLLFCNSHFNAVDASLSIMFNFGACPEFSNISYNTSYICNMSASLLVLMGSTKITFVSYLYSINMYCILLLLVTGKLTVKYVYTFPVSGFASPRAENIQVVFSSLWEKEYFSISSAIFSLF